MKVRNLTDYRTDDLRKIFAAGLKAEGASLRDTFILVVYIQGSSVSGRASLGRWTGNVNRGARKLSPEYRSCYWIRMELPRPGKKINLFDRPSMIKELAQVLVHEIGHNLELQHREMAPLVSIEVPWAEGLQLRVKDKKPKPTLADRANKRESHVRKMVDKYERQLARTERLLKKWRKKLKHYEAKHRREKMRLAAAKGSDDGDSANS